jgi:4-hydroxybenzoate polyprenyltransferase
MRRVAHEPLDLGAPRPAWWTADYEEAGRMETDRARDLDSDAKRQPSKTPPGAAMMLLLAGVCMVLAGAVIGEAPASFAIVAAILGVTAWAIVNTGRRSRR